MAWQPTPRFRANKIISAAGHINPLIIDVDHLYALLTTNQNANAGVEWNADWSGGFSGPGEWTTIYTGALRHRFPRLVTRVYCKADKSVDVRVSVRDIGGNTVTQTFVAGVELESDIVLNLNGLNERDFYIVDVDGRTSGIGTSRVWVVTMYEHNPDSNVDYPDLWHFVSGVPAASHFNELSEAADLLHRQFNHKVNGMAAYGYTPYDHNKTANPLLGRFLIHTGLFHSGNSLFVDMTMREPSPEDNDPYLITHIYVNGQVWKSVAMGKFANNMEPEDTVFTVRESDHNGNSYLQRDHHLKNGDELVLGNYYAGNDREIIRLGGFDGDRTWNNCERGLYNTTPRRHTGNTAGGKHFAHYISSELGQTDPDTNPRTHRYIFGDTISHLGVTLNQPYRVDFRVQYDTYQPDADYPQGGKVYADQVGEYVPAGTVVTNPNYTPIELFEHLDVVTGVGGMKVIRDNLDFLIGESDYRAIASSKNHREYELSIAGNDRNPTFRSVASIRRHDWLWYYNDPIATDDDGNELESISPQIKFYWNGWQTLGLSNQTGEWLVYDLNSVQGLWPGTPYYIDDVTFALEDSDPYTSEDNIA